MPTRHDRPPRRRPDGAASCALVLLVVTGCSVTRQIEWGYELTPELAANEVIAASIQLEGCAPQDSFLFFGLLGTRTYTLPPFETPGRYCFAIEVQDTTTCETTRSDTRTIELDPSQDVDLVQQPAALATPRACDGTCVPGAGCLRCAEESTLCADNMHCCPIASFCDDLDIFGDGGGCDRIR
ncbi:MAG: hypothetical protein AB7S26_13860 [Sandaracinaceae bacterium]